MKWLFSQQSLIGVPNRSIKFASISLVIFFLLNILLIKPAYTADLYPSGDGIPIKWQLAFQPPATESMEQIISVHNFVMYIMVAIVLAIGFAMVYISIRFSKKNNPNPSTNSHNTKLEIIWTLVPLLLIIVIAIPSYKLIKKNETIPEYNLTLKVIGNQWYWTYSYPDQAIGFDSNIKQDSDLLSDDHRLFAVDHEVILPTGVNIKFIITASDVIHSWAVPSFGIKTDAIPGKLNETWVNIKRSGVYYGQCSELCGTLHGFMPIVIRAVSKQDFQKWVEEAKTKFAL